MSDDLGGGIWWRKDNSSKNTPSNMPAAILAARLYKKFSNPGDLQWAKDIYHWQKSVLYDASSGWVYDNIDKNSTKILPGNSLITRALFWVPHWNCTKLPEAPATWAMLLRPPTMR